MYTKKMSYYVLILIAFIGFKTQAQSPVHFGIKAGANFTELSKSIKDYNSESSTGFAIGAALRVDIKRTYLQAEFLYTEKNVNLKGESISLKPKMKNIEIPLVFGVKLIDLKAFNLRAYGGGVYSKIVENNFDKQDVSQVFHDFDKDNIGLRLGAGIDVLSFTLDVSYDMGFKNVSNTYETKPKTWLVSVGYFFL